MLGYWPVSPRDALVSASARITNKDNRPELSPQPPQSTYDVPNRHGETEASVSINKVSLQGESRDLLTTETSLPVSHVASGWETSTLRRAHTGPQSFHPSPAVLKHLIRPLWAFTCFASGQFLLLVSTARWLQVHQMGIIC